MMRLDKRTWEKLEALSRHFGVSITEVIRQLVIQATPEECPKSWDPTLGADREGGDA